MTLSDALKQVGAHFKEEMKNRNLGLEMISWGNRSALIVLLLNAIALAVFINLYNK